VPTALPSTKRTNLYVAVDRQNTLIRISPEGTITTLATASDGLDYPASTSFDQGHGTRKLLYFTNAGLIQHAEFAESRCRCPR